LRGDTYSGAMTLSIMTFRIMTFRIMTFTVITLRITAFSIMTFSNNSKLSMTLSTTTLKHNGRVLVF